MVRKLPRRSHDLSRLEVEESQRWRLLEAMTEVTAKVGYADASVADVIRVAGISRKTFYEQFRDKEECFLCAYDVLSDRMLGVIVAVGAEVPRGPRRRRAQLETFLGVLRKDLAVARVFMVDVLGAGARALERRQHVNARFAEAFLGDAVDATRRAAIVGGINNVVAGALIEGRATALAELLVPLAAFVEQALPPRA